MHKKKAITQPYKKQPNKNTKILLCIFRDKRDFKTKCSHEDLRRRSHNFNEYQHKNHTKN